MKEYYCIILGAGVTGLTAAYELTKKGKKILILEREKQPGGMLRVQKINDYFIEEYYHHVFKRDYEFIDLLKDVGLYEKFRFYKTSTSFLYNKKFEELSKPLDLVFFKPLSLHEKIQFILLMLKIKFIKNPKDYDNISAKGWIIKNSGTKVFEKMFRPLLRSKFGNDMDNISAAWFIERMQARSGRDSSGEQLGYIDGSFGVFIKKMENKIKENGCEIKYNCKIKKLLIKNNKIYGIELGNEKIKTCTIISTIPPKELIKIGSFPKMFAKQLEQLEYQGCISILLGLNKKLTDFYWTNIIHENIAFGSIIEHTNFQPLINYGEHIAYLASYPDIDSELWKMKDKTIYEKYMSDLKKLIMLDENDIKWFKVFRTKEAGLIYKKGITSNIIDIQTPVDGLMVGGMFNSFPDRNINTSVKIGMKCANKVKK